MIAVRRVRSAMATPIEDAESYRCEACGDEFDAESDLRDHLYSVGLMY